jgi:pyridoxamine 5'-phosphate oxidase
MDLGELRKEYTKHGLDLETVSDDPVSQFEKWFDEAMKAELLEPNAMILSTVDQYLQPYQRTVLLKAFDERGFVFYTNYTSRKSDHIEKNPKVNLLFPWYGLERQVAITGEAEKISSMESFKYFTSRPHGSQLGAWVSNQSSIISSRSILEKKLDEMKRKFKEGKVPLPDFWGGYRVKPTSFEFWQGRPNRLHDRILYTYENDNSWDKKRLAP